jgi:hypothetical protein
LLPSPRHTRRDAWPNRLTCCKALWTC